MKTIKFLIVCLLLSLTSVFQSCSNDDDYDKDDLYGKWQGIREEGYYKENGKVMKEYDDDISGDRLFIEFEKGGTFVIWEGNSSNEGSWSLNGSKLTLSYDDEDEIMTGEIETLTSTTLVTVFEEYDEDGDYFYEKTTFVRVD
ncbi:MAG: lipocalin family protein [Tannerellaceae bacterium]|nr:lipocalin family protein [Tannerellaceae bacterium]